MTPDRWRELTRLFEVAIDLPIEERAPYLDQACPPDASFRAELEELLAAAPNAASRIAGIVALPPIPSEVETTGEPAPGQLVGAYCLEEEVGRGGMGTVWRASRVEGGFRQTVAVKLIKRGMDTREVIRRFTQERQILSILDHPHIARLLDGGSTNDGRPYLVMEYMEGLPLLEYCDRHQVGERRRLELFQTICAAVQHAHNHLVIHRDLKPRNVIIREQGDVKLLDFGIAKLMESGPGAGETITVAQVLTPAYASPEQREGQPLTTASDIYSLGLMLGDLCGESAPRDLRAIIARATRREPHHRYSTAERLAEDVGRYLKGQPVEARSGAFAYQVSRFFSRHAVATIAVFGLLAAALGVLGYVTVQRRNVALERDRAENIARFLRELFSAADPERNRGNRLSTREMLDIGAARVRSVADAGARAALMETIGEAYFNLGLYEKASAVYTELIQSERSRRTPDQARLARSYAILSESESYRGHGTEADRAAATALSLATGATRDLRAIVFFHQCNQLFQADRYAAAISACRQASREAAGSTLENTAVARIQISLGNALKEDSQFGEAEAAFREALRLARTTPDESLNPAASQALASLGGLYFRQGRFADAEKAFREDIEFKRRLYPEGHIELARSLNNLANTLTTLKHPQEAMPVFAEAHQLYRKFLGDESSELAVSLSNLAVAYSVANQLDDAERLLGEAMRIQLKTSGQGKLPYLASQLKYGAILIERKKFKAAIPVLEDSLASILRLETLPKLEIGYNKALLAQGLLETGERERAEALAREAHPALQALLKEDHWMLLYSQTVLAGALIRNGKTDEGRALLLPVVARYEATSAKGWRADLARSYARQLPSARK